MVHLPGEFRKHDDVEIGLRCRARQQSPDLFGVGLQNWDRPVGANANAEASSVGQIDAAQSRLSRTDADGDGRDRVGEKAWWQAGVDDHREPEIAIATKRVENGAGQNPASSAPVTVSAASQVVAAKHEWTGRSPISSIGETRSLSVPSAAWIGPTTRADSDCLTRRMSPEVGVPVMEGAPTSPKVGVPRKPIGSALSVDPVHSASINRRSFTATVAPSLVPDPCRPAAGCSRS